MAYADADHRVDADAPVEIGAERQFLRAHCIGNAVHLSVHGGGECRGVVRPRAEQPILEVCEPGRDLAPAVVERECDGRGRMLHADVHCHFLC